MRIENTKMYQIFEELASLATSELSNKRAKSTSTKNPRTRVNACRNSSIQNLVKNFIYNLSQFQNPKSEIQNPNFLRKGLLLNGPKSKTKIQNQNLKFQIHNPKPKIQKPKSQPKLILDVGILVLINQVFGDGGSMAQRSTFVGGCFTCAC